MNLPSRSPDFDIFHRQYLEQKKPEFSKRKRKTDFYSSYKTRTNCPWKRNYKQIRKELDKHTEIDKLTKNMRIMHTNTMKDRLKKAFCVMLYSWVVRQIKKKYYSRDWLTKNAPNIIEFDKETSFNSQLKFYNRYFEWHKVIPWECEWVREGQTSS